MSKNNSEFASKTFAASSPFFVTGGTLPLDAASYVARAADEELYQSLRRGEFCYVLNTRQMGKSSLMIRTARRLHQDGRQVLLLDLTGVGQNLSVEQWYFGLLDLAAAQTQREDALFAFWKTHKELGAMQRFVAAVRRVLLTPQEGDLGKVRDLVIFVDEIDAVRSLPFSADEFFAGIRACCNRNAQNADGGQLTFCLLGVATPSDLIRDTRVTPFNIGRRIELHDFTREEAAPLAAGLRRQETGEQEAIHNSEAEALLERILYWTGGHPYMTQRLCRAVAESLHSPGASGKRDEIEDAVLVDTLCQRLFLTKAARETDDNLAFVRTRLLHSEVERAALLDVYGQVRRGRRVRDDETNALCPVLRLSGVVKAANGWLVLRNEIYSRVFDAAWIAEQMPDAEVRRQKRAYRRGVLRAAMVFGSLSVVIGTLLFAAILNANRARYAESLMQKEAKNAREQAQTASQLVYDADMNQMQHDWNLGNFTAAAELLEATHRNPARHFEWDYWNALHNEFAPPLNFLSPSYVLIAPDNRTVGAILRDENDPQKSTFTAWDIFTGEMRFSTPARTLAGQMLSYAPDGKRLLLCVGKTVEVRDMQDGHLLQTVPAHHEDVISFQFTADGAAILVARADGSLSLWDCRTKKTLWGSKTRADINVCIAVSDHHAATMTWEGILQIWDLQTGGEIYRNERDFARGPLSFSPSARFLVGQARGSGVELLDLTTRIPRNLPEITGGICSFHFSSDGNRLMVGCTGSVCVFDMPSGRRLNASPQFDVPYYTVLISPNGRFAIRGEPDNKYHFVRTLPLAAFFCLVPLETRQSAPSGRVVRRDVFWNLCYSPDGSQLAAVCSNGNVYLWDTHTGRLTQTLRGDGITVNAMSFSHEGTRIALGDCKGRVSLWDWHSGQRLVRFRAHVLPVKPEDYQSADIYAVCFTPDDRQIVTASGDFTAKIWDVPKNSTATPSLRLTLQGHQLAVRCAALSPDGTMVLTGSDDQTARLWECRTGRLLYQFPSSVEVRGVNWSPDGKQVALANLWKTIPVWDVSTKQMIHVLSGHQRWVTSVVYSPDGKRILSGSSDNTAILWDAQTGRELLTLRGHAQEVVSVAFAPNGRQIATTSQDGDVRLWNAEAETSDPFVAEDVAP